MINSVQPKQPSSSAVYGDSELSVARLRNSLSTIATLIERGNEKLWPVFEKLEDELLRLEQKEMRLSRYSNIS